MELSALLTDPQWCPHGTRGRRGPLCAWWFMLWQGDSGKDRVGLAMMACLQDDSGQASGGLATQESYPGCHLCPWEPTGWASACASDLSKGPLCKYGSLCPPLC